MFERCGVCGAAAQRMRVDPDGMLVCPTHRLCRQCRISHPGPCPEADAAALTVEAVLAVGAVVHRDLAAVGIRLPSPPVRMRALPPPQEGRCLKASGPAQARGCRIDIVPGLGPTRLGWVWAHEHTHALLWLQHAAALSAELEEGVAQMVALVWLTTRPTPTPARVVAAYWANPDPVYGKRMRQVVSAARRHGVPQVLADVAAHGRLPA